MSKSVCIVSNEIFGPHKNGGIGTSQTFLALLLSHENYAVTVLYTGDIAHRDSAYWEQWYGRAGIRFVHLPSARRRVYPQFLEKSHNIFDFLVAYDFDIVVLQDWGGDGYALTAAKRCGIFANTVFITWLHSPNVWCMYANQERSGDIDLLYRNEMERAAVENSDLIWAPSQYMINWLVDRGWNISSRAVVRKLFIPPIVLSEDHPPETVAASPKRWLNRKKRVDTLIFFGRLERRKGVSVFTRAVSQSARIQNSVKRIVFVGKPANIGVEQIRSDLSLTNPGIQVDFFTDLNSAQAMELLRRVDGLVIMPSLEDNSPCVVYECLMNDIQFISSTNGGMAELIHENDHALHVCSPRSDKLAALIEEHIANPKRLIAKGSFDPEELKRDYLRAFANMPFQEQVAAAPIDASQVTVVLTHYERPLLLRQTLEAFAKQTFTGFRVIVVDDASTSTAARKYIDELRSLSFPFEISVVQKKENQYLGAARNTGLALVETPYVVFFDDDNIPFPTMIENYLSAIQSSGADTVTCLMVGFEGTVPSLHDVYGQPHWGFVPFTLSPSIWMNNFGDAAAIYRVSAVRAVGGFHERHGVTHEDWGLHVKLSQAGYKKAYLPRPVFWYRGSADSMIRTTNRYLNDQVQLDLWSDMVPPQAKAAIEFALGLRSRILEAEGAVREAYAHLDSERRSLEKGEASARAQLRRLSYLLGRGG